MWAAVWHGKVSALGSSLSVNLSPKETINTCIFTFATRSPGSEGNFVRTGFFVQGRNFNGFV